jgi:hypothetical protein
MDMSLKIARLRFLLHCFGAINVVFNQIVLRADQRWRHVARHPECRRIIWGSHRDMSISIEDAIVVEDVAGRNEAFEEVLKADLFAFREISGRHNSRVGMVYAT